MLTIVVGAAVAAARPLRAGRLRAAQTGADPAKISLTGVDLGQVIVALLAVLAIGGEYGTGMIRVTLAAMPRRLVMLAAKAVVVTGWAVAAGAAAVLGSVLAGRLILPGRGLSAANGYVLVSLGNGPDLRAAAGTMLYLALIALLALGRHHGGPRLRRRHRPGARRAVPVPDRQLGDPGPGPGPPPAADRPDDRGPVHPGHASASGRLPLTPWQGLGVLAAWAAGALLLGAAAAAPARRLTRAGYGGSRHCLPGIARKCHTRARGQARTFENAARPPPPCAAE